MGQQTGVPGVFVTATDTEVGKTQVACWLARHWGALGLRVGVCKPAATGAVRRGASWVWPDVDRLRATLVMDEPEGLVGPFRWRLPLAPAVAHRLEPPLVSPAGCGTGPTRDDFRAPLDAWNGKCDVLIVEGTGGLLCPLPAGLTCADVAADWGRPVLIVARLGLGTLNHTLLTVEAAQQRRLRLAGIVLNSPRPPAGDLAEQTNPEELRRRLALPIWGPLPYQPDPHEIPQAIRDIDWKYCTGLRPAPEKSTHD